MDYYTMVDYHITVDYYTMVDCYITVDYYTTVDYYITVDYYTSPSVRQPVSWLVTSKPYSAQLSSTDALGCQLEQHTQITLKAHFKCDRHAKVGRWRWGWHYVFFPTYPKDPQIVSYPLATLKCSHALTSWTCAAFFFKTKY